MPLPGCDSDLAVDGVTNGDYHGKLSCIQTSNAPNQTWSLDLGRKYQVSKVKIFGRTDEGSQSLIKAEVFLDGFRCGVLERSVGSTFTVQCKYRMGQTVKIWKRNGGFSLCEIKVYGVDFEKMISQGKKTTQSSTSKSAMPIGSSDKAVDSATDGYYAKGSCTHTKKATHQWWEVHLAGTYKVTKVVIWNRQDCCMANLKSAKVSVIDRKNRDLVCGWIPDTKPHRKYEVGCSSHSGERVRVQLTSKKKMVLTLCEVQVFIDDSSPEAERMCQAEYGLRIATRSWTLANSLRHAEGMAVKIQNTLKASADKLQMFNRKIGIAKKSVHGAFREDSLKGREGKLERNVNDVRQKIEKDVQSLQKVYQNVNAFKTMALKSASYATVIYRLGRPKDCVQDRSPACAMETQGLQWSGEQFAEECNGPMASYKVTMNVTATVQKQICPETRVPFSRLTTCLDLTKRPKFSVSIKDKIMKWSFAPKYGSKDGAKHAYEVGPASGTEYMGWYMIPIVPQNLKYWIGARVALNQTYWRDTKTSVSWLDIVNQNNQNDYVTCTLLNGGHRKLKDSFEDYYEHCASACSHASIDMCSSTQCIVNQLLKKGNFSSSTMSMCDKKARKLISAFDLFLDRSTFDALTVESDQLAAKLQPKRLISKLKAIWRQDNKDAAKMYLRNAFLQYKTAYKTARNLRMQVCPKKTTINQDFPTMNRFINVIPSLLRGKTDPTNFNADQLKKEIESSWSKTGDQRTRLNAMWNERPTWIFRVLEFRQELVNQQNAFSLAASILNKVALRDAKKTQAGQQEALDEALIQMGWGGGAMC
jgi:hypothetical protein